MDNLAGSMAVLYRDVVEDYGDPRTQNWIGIRSPWLTLLTMSLYLALVTNILPRYMKNRPPFEFRKLMLVYNFTLSIYSFWTFMQLGFAGWFWNIDYRCFPTNYDINHENLLMLNITWYFWVSKFVELLDTVFFILRKKNNQVTVLHLYHHCTMIFNVWITLKVTAVGHFTFVGLTNSFVHFFMYGYYGLAAIGPHMQKYLGWKKYITKIQLIQFVLNIIHATQVLFNDCNVSKTLVIISTLQSFIFFILFLNFYSKAYSNRNSHSKLHSNGNTTHLAVASSYANRNSSIQSKQEGSFSENGGVNGIANGKQLRNRNLKD